MATRGDAVQAARETARVTVSTVVKGIAGGVVTVGAKTPIVAPLCAALLEAKALVDAAGRNKEDLEEVSARCELITVHVIDKFKASPTSMIDVAPLEECVEKLKKVATRYHDQGRFSRMVQFRRDGDDIRRLRDRIDAIVPIMGLATSYNTAKAVTNIEGQLKNVQDMVVGCCRVAHEVGELESAIPTDQKPEAPGLGEAGENYVKKLLEQESLRCLVVGDDVWETSVVEKLKETGMWVFLTTRTASMMEPNERVVVDKLEAAEAEEAGAAVLLDDEEHLTDHHMQVAAGTITILERWAVLRAHSSDLYCMHDAHVDFARGKLMGWEDVRRPAIDRRPGGQRRGRGCSSELYRSGRPGWGLDATQSRSMRTCGRPAGGGGSVYHTSAEDQGGRLGVDDSQVAVTLHELGQCVREAGRPGEAETLLRRAVEIDEAELEADDLQVAVTLVLYGQCVREAGRPGEAEALLRRAVEIKETEWVADDLQVAVVLHELGQCVRGAGRPGEAAESSRRAVEIKEAELGADDPQVAVKLFVDGQCVREAGRPGEAEALLRRAVEVKEAGLGADDP
eukprot:g13042.t1